jgi:hypothetical protein
MHRRTISTLPERTRRRSAFCGGCCFATRACWGSRKDLEIRYSTFSDNVVITHKVGPKTQMLIQQLTNFQLGAALPGFLLRGGITIGDVVHDDEVVFGPEPAPHRGTSPGWPAFLQACLLAIPGVTVNRLCGSGLEAVAAGSRAIKAGEGAFYIAVGVEA